MTGQEDITRYFRSLQDGICASLEAADGKALFREDAWKRPGGGGGRTRVMENGDLIEKGGVNFSAVFGEMPGRIRTALQLGGKEFYATGVSVVLHPRNPFVPIIHMNVRYFAMDDGEHWFGGGIDLTPHYISEAEAKQFHGALKKLCDRHHPSFYTQFRDRADDYFFIEHRNETRGIGGIFFDRLKESDDMTWAQCFDFVKDTGNLFAPLYTGLAAGSRNRAWSDRERSWQLLRRGRYVEFNLIYDKGTKFGLATGGRAESILMSLPPDARWLYSHQPETGSEEEKTLKFLRKGVKWV